ncbi:hypothetical protein M5K25_025379 [Dendrobium thyrsiflorum]|uniref:Uncharacterized protein n=1 Tax=Dendrobium thyrsiflorum TaxID=117978 RepID=A0ABD0U8X6_DENTH
MVEDKRSVRMVEALLLLLLITGSLQKPAMAARPLGGKLAFMAENIEDLFLESLPKGPQPPSQPSCESHSNISCPPPQK